MANKTQVALLQRSVREWNSWLKSNRESNPDLSGPDLRGADLRSADLRGADLSGADLSDADLSAADLRNANLGEANLSKAILYLAIVSMTVFNRANLSGADLYGVNLSGSGFNEADLSDANLSGADLTDAHTYFASFDRAQVSDTTKGLESLRNEQRASLQLVPRLEDEVEEQAKRFSITAIRATPATAEYLAKNRDDLTELLEKLDSFIPQEEDADGENRTPIPLSRKEYETAVAAVQATIAFHKVENIDSWDERVRGVITRLNEILKDLEVLGRQFGKTLSAWVPIAGLLRRVIKAIDAMLEDPKARDTGEDE